MPNRVLLTGLQLIFRAVTRLRPEVAAPFNPEAIRRILLFNTTAIGDTLLSTPAIRAVRKGFPRAYIVALASPSAREVLLHNPFLDEILLHPGRVNFPYVFRLPGLLRALRSRRFGLAIIFHANDPDAAPLAYLSGAPYRMGWRESRLSFLFTHPVPSRRSGVHAVDLRLRNLEELGIASQGRDLEIFLQPEEEERGRLMARRLGLEGRPFIAVHPFGNKQNRWWPEPHVTVLARRLIDVYGVQVLVVGGPKEAAIANRMVDQAKVKSLAGRSTIRETAALLKRCVLMISTDSGPMHLAQALDLPTLALYGPSDPVLTGPTRPHSLVIAKDCSTAPCMETIRVEEVLKSVEEMVARGWVRFHR
ncbi:MAG: glycosyltransferase family 9 protein [Nitrospirae bacterium]|nr:glycosyltransferase family 9 protein [Nitrospirota bacterium]